MVGEVSEHSLAGGRRVADGDVGTRAASGALLAVLALAANYLGGLYFTALVVAVAVAMAWEWGQVVRGPEGLSGTLAAHVAGVGGAALLMVQDMSSGALAVLVAGAAIAAFLAPRRYMLFSGLGVLYVGLPVVALLWFRGDHGYGMLAVLLLFVIVWMADTFAYVSGKLLQGPRLWPSLSRNKTWAGLIGGVTAASAGAAMFGWLVIGGDPVKFAAAGCALGALSQAGDLGESALKRHFGVKNASNLIPGHGGVMDRMDGIVAAVVGGAIFALLSGVPEPARALLFLP